MTCCKLKEYCFSFQVQDTSAHGAAPPVNAIIYIQNLLELKDRYDRFLTGAFGNDKYFKQVMFFFLIICIKLIYIFKSYSLF